MNLLSYKGYTGQVEFDAEEQCLVGRVIGINDVITFESDSAAAIEQEFQTSVDVYLADCDKIGKEPAKSFSGRFVVRVSSERHQAVALAAAGSGLSMNAWVDDALAAALHQPVVRQTLAG